ncbi:MAG: cytochrome c [Holophagales bacterium]|nr:cytochrome c [Holophagales bacterium]MYF97037.1 cytochrome c [Holophagales bacterium]
MRLTRLAPILTAAVALAACMAIVAPSVAASEHEEPVGNLAELMRAILFPNSNHLFDVQSYDPEAPPEASDSGDGSASARFASIYTGWQVPQQAALALAEVEPQILNPDRMCENGKPAPVQKDDYQEYARKLTEVAKKIYTAAHEKDRDKVSDLTNELAGACEDCHFVYRKYQDRCDD